ncbi:unnamed protein product [Cochlearia groenlandica]
MENIVFLKLSGGILGALLIDVSGRRTLLLVSQGGMFLGCIATSTSFFMQKYNLWETGTPYLALISVLVYFGSYGLGMGPIPWTIASEIYPIDVKGAAGTVCNLASSISSWFVTYFFSFLLTWSSTGTFGIFAIVMGLGFVFTAKPAPETKGKSLEEIQSNFTDSPLQDSSIF